MKVQRVFSIYEARRVKQTGTMRKNLILFLEKMPSDLYLPIVLTLPTLPFSVKCFTGRACTLYITVIFRQRYQEQRYFEKKY